MHIDGACHCGAVRFTADIDPTQVVACHCTDCQTLSGAPFRTTVALPAERFHVKGAVKVYVKEAASGNRRAQAFCPECGTPIYAGPADENPPSTVVVLRLGCVRQRAELKPGLQLWRRSAMPWLHALDDVPAHEQGR